MIVYFSKVTIIIKGDEKRNCPLYKEEFSVHTIRPIATVNDEHAIAEYLMRSVYSYTDMEKIEVENVDLFKVENGKFPTQFLDKVVVF